MIRQGQQGLELPVLVAEVDRLPGERPAEGPLRGGDEGAPVPRLNLGEAAQDRDVPRCALSGLDGAFRCSVAALRDPTDGDERAGRALAARHHKQAARRQKARSLRPSDLRGLQESDGVLRPLGRQQVPWRHLPRRPQRLVVAPRDARQEAIEHAARGCSTVSRARVAMVFAVSSYNLKTTQATNQISTSQKN